MNKECIDCDQFQACYKKNIHHYGHELRSADIAREFFEDHRFSARTKKLAIAAAKHHMNFHWLTKMKPVKIVRFLRSIPRDLFFEVIEVANCDHSLTKEQRELIDLFDIAMKATAIEIPERIKKDGMKIAEFVDNEITKTFKRGLLKGDE